MSTHYYSPPSFHHHLHPPHHHQLFHGVCSFKDKDKRIHLDNILRCSRRNAISKHLTQDEEYEVIQHSLPVIKWQEEEEEDDDHLRRLDQQHRNVSLQKVIPIREIEARVEAVRLMFETMNDGEISVSAYDTAWVALVEDLEGKGGPQFPTAIQWIAQNQLEDGSWGETAIFSAHDRIINTLACVVALKTWKIHLDKCERGLKFLQDNLLKLEDEDPERMPIGFEVVFPSLLEIARNLDIDIAYDSPVMQEIYSRREIKLSRIPKEIVQQVPSTLLHSLEGMKGLDWEKLMRLQSKDGSFLFSPSSTAFALIQTNDPNCFNYLTNAVRRFNGGVPNVYPVDLFEHMWVVDRLQRLGLSRYFDEEINDCMNYVARYWTKNGICWARNAPVSDIDDTSMGFRLLRLHGHEVSAEVFEQFKKGEEFFSFLGQSTEAVTGMYNLYRASQMRFPEETILEDANKYSSNFLAVKREADNLLDKWIITKDLPGEVSYALDVPWYASLPRVETRFYLDQYGGEHDIWIGKTYYRMPNVNNDIFLELAKMDYNNCQLLHLSEWDSIQRWYTDWKLEDFGVTRKTLLHSFFVAAASIFEPERSRERLAWAKSSVLVEAISSCFDEKRSLFVQEFTRRNQKQPYINGRNGSVTNKIAERLAEATVGILDQLSVEMLVGTGRDITRSLYNSWKKWLKGWLEGGEKNKGVVELLVQMIYLCNNSSSGIYHRNMSKATRSQPQYQYLCNLTSEICLRLDRLRKKNVRVNVVNDPEIVQSMEELVKLVFGGTTDDDNVIDKDVRKTFFEVTRGFYYYAHCDEILMDQHVAKVLLESVL